MPRAVLSINAQNARWWGDRPVDVSNATFAPPHDPLSIVQDALDSTAHLSSGFWIGYFSYDLGRVIEPKATSKAHSANSAAAVDDRGWPLVELAWCPDAIVFDNQSRRHSDVGDAVSLLNVLHAQSYSTDAVPRFGELKSSLNEHQYLDAAQSIIDAIVAGDIFQANLTQRFSCEFSGSARSMALDALQRSGAWYGAYLEFPLSGNDAQSRAICSLSPELFLSFDAQTRRVMTRPIKGTRPVSTSPRELKNSQKDIAELNMIIDLMRNDLGRVCEFGSVRVPKPRKIESHAGVHHGVGEVTGIVRNNCTITDLLRATFPAGSITGAPKIRAMQLIDEIEPVRRGAYCGAIGVISAAGDMTLNVGIRTIALTGSRTENRYDIYKDAVLDYGAGGAIVADSTPEEEYRESMDKTAVLRDVIGEASAGLCEKQQR